MKAVISGICGMDASHLADLLLEEGYHVRGFYRRSSVDKFDRISHLLGHPNFEIEEGDLTDSGYISHLLDEYRPDVFFNAAAQSHVATSFKQPHFTFDVNTKGVLNILEGIRTASPNTKLIQFCTSEMWGNSIDDDNMQRETTPWEPRSPYAVSKQAAFDLCRTYRESYDIFACCSICHNHTGPRRGDNFVEKKIVNWVASHHDTLLSHKALRANNEIYKVGDDPDFDDYLYLGNLDAYRDFSHSKDCVKAIYLMSQMDKPKDYVIASGVPCSVRNLLERIFAFYDADYNEYVRIDPKFFRPAEVDYLCGDSTLIRNDLGWEPEYDLSMILKEMLDARLEEAKV